MDPIRTYGRGRLLLAVLSLIVITAANAETRDHTYDGATHTQSHTFQPRPEDARLGLQPVECWFDKRDAWPDMDCFEMHTPENHGRPDARTITFPVLLIRADKPSGKAPVLHLGGGGPGGALYLDYAESIDWLLQMHDALSLELGRDLIFIDPRGAGLSQPKLNCIDYTRNQEGRLGQDLSLASEVKAYDDDFLRCLKRFDAQGIGLPDYNSSAVAKDIELLRRRAGVEQWVLIGVSHAAIYAQLIAARYADTVESMILDSAAFANLRLHENFVETHLAQFKALYNYCELSAECIEPYPDFKARFWQRYDKLNQQPISIDVEHPFEERSIKFVLNGDRYISTVINGIYSPFIFADIPLIVSELEQGNTELIKPYVEEYLLYLLDDEFSEVSMLTHFCVEERMVSDVALLTSLLESLPAGPIRLRAGLSMNWSHYCTHIGASWLTDAVTIDAPLKMPTLFLQGELDFVTPLADVVRQQSEFPHSQLLRFQVAHSVSSSVDCAESLVAQFIANPTAPVDQGNCR